MSKGGRVGRAAKTTFHRSRPLAFPADRVGVNDPIVPPTESPRVGGGTGGSRTGWRRRCFACGVAEKCSGYALTIAEVGANRAPCRTT